jgi:hypothetical protein
MFARYVKKTVLKRVLYASKTNSKSLTSKGILTLLMLTQNILNN